MRVFCIKTANFNKIIFSIAKMVCFFRILAEEMAN